MSHDAALLLAVFARIDAENAGDPVYEAADDGQTMPRAELYGRRMSARVNAFMPDAPFELHVACRAQHLGRWRVPRSDYPSGRDGYRQWRTELGRLHAEWTATILRELCVAEDAVTRVRALLTKHKFKLDPLGQALEDVACLVFLQHYFAAFATEHSDEKVVDIVAKTWKKMLAQGHAVALTLPLAPREAELVGRALRSSSAESAP